MKRVNKILLCLVLVLMVLVSCNAFNTNKLYAETSQTKIIVTGSGSITVIPDLAVVNVGVESLNLDINTAVEENNNSVGKIIEYLKSNGVLEENITTKNYSVYQRYNYTEETKFIGYQVENSLEFKTTDLENLGNVITDLTDLGANRLGGITFTCSNPEKHYNDALKLALENAKTKAKILNENAELNVCKIVEKSVGYCDIYRDSAFVLARAKKETVMQGNMQIEAKIEVTFGSNFDEENKD